ncbi:hypothetical protein HRS9139_08491 [Pyrenophora teres f. teres]|nr:hypothetical protein HRS9139_08491 [Pyrenophora teres f. teres]
MAAQEYYMGTQGAHELAGNHLYPPQPPKPPQYQQPSSSLYANAPGYANTPPPNYSPYPQPPQHHQGYPPQHQQSYPEKSSQAMTAPYPQTPPSGYHPSQHYMMPQPHQRPQQNNHHLGVPMQPTRSHSQPPARVHFADYDSDASTSLGSISSSDEATASPPPRRYRHRSHSRPERAHTPDAYDTNNRSYDRDDRHRRHKHSEKDKDKSHSGAHKTRDTFLGAGAGTIIGDAIFPGLGTAAGLVLGGYGGRKDRGRDRERKGNRRVGVDGWDDKTKTFKKGGAVR